MEDIVVRKAAMQDLATLKRFQQGIANAERVFDPTIKDGAVQYYDMVAIKAYEKAGFGQWVIDMRLNLK
jgi:hypothetical protein